MSTKPQRKRLKSDDKDCTSKLIRERELFHALASVESEEFIADLLDHWRTSAELARVAIAGTSEIHKFSVLLAHINALSAWLLRRVRDSLVSRFHLGKSANPAAFSRIFGWAVDETGTDIAIAILPGGAGWRYVAGHPSAGQPVPSNGTVALEDIQEISYSLLEQDENFYARVAQPWLKRACAGWQIPASEMSDWLVPLWINISQVRGHDGCLPEDRTIFFVLEVATKLKSEIEAGRRFAHDHVLSISMGVNRALTSTKEGRTLRKQNDMSKFFDAACLTERQRECASLRWEYGLTVSEIAARIRIHRTTVDEHLANAHIKINRSCALQGTSRRSALNNPDDF